MDGNLGLFGHSGSLTLVLLIVEKLSLRETGLAYKVGGTVRSFILI
jgi:hypothetical protein